LAQDVVEAVCLAPVEHLRAGVMAVGTDQDLRLRPVRAEGADETAEKGADLRALGPLCRTQHGGNEAAVAVEHDNRLEAVFVVMGVEQTQLLAAMDRIESVVDVEGDPTRDLAERRTVEIDQRPGQADERSLLGQILQPRNGRLRAQVPLRRQAFERDLEQRIVPQASGVIAVLIAGGDHQQPEADNVGDRVHGAGRITRIVDTGGKTLGHLEPLLDRAQHQQAAIGRQPAAVKAGDDFFAGNG
jgi:hypothetical protein